MLKADKRGAAASVKGLMVAGLGGGAGKSLVTVGITAAFAGQGLRLAPFKKGPDYIDAAWLAKAAGFPCYNLDPFLMSEEAILTSFARHCRNRDMAIVEGNRGLYDGVDVEGSFSSAELAKSLGLPVLLVVDCTKTTRTVAALVLGCRQFDPDLDLAGVILNRVGTGRQEQLIRQAVERYAGLPVLGAVPRTAKDVFPQRHLGLTPCPEHQDADEAVRLLAEKAASCLDLSAIKGIMAPLVGDKAEPGSSSDIMPSGDKKATIQGESALTHCTQDRVRIGILRDAAFQFYYAENLEALVVAGADLIEINALTCPKLPIVDGLYIGGGFPETSARELSDNTGFMDSVRDAAQAGLPIYAECGGLIYLGREMLLADERFPMVGVFPVAFGLRQRPQAHGYTVLRVKRQNPYYPLGMELKGHEFRYSRVEGWQDGGDSLVFQMERGVGFAEGGDGLLFRNVLALYSHIHALGCPAWAPALVEQAQAFAARLKR